MAVDSNDDSEGRRNVDIGRIEWECCRGRGECDDVLCAHICGRASGVFHGTDVRHKGRCSAVPSNSSRHCGDAAPNDELARSSHPARQYSASGPRCVSGQLGLLRPLTIGCSGCCRGDAHHSLVCYRPRRCCCCCSVRRALSEGDA